VGEDERDGEAGERAASGRRMDEDEEGDEAEDKTT
jgi:hypothetical protein